MHELGHFFAARWFGVRVEEFGIGIPPRLLGKKIGETLYSINLLPFGGFVKLTGENALEVSEANTPVNDPHNFMSKSSVQRLIILAAGVAMNLTMAVMFYYVFLAANNFKTLTLPLFFDYNFSFGEQRVISTVITGIEEKSPAFAAGLRRGEAIIEVDGAPVYNHNDIKARLEGKGGEEVKVLLMDVAGLSRDLRVVSVGLRGKVGEDAILGVLLAKAVTVDYAKKPLLSGFSHVYNMAAYSVFTLYKLVGLSVAQRDITPVSSSISGPVGIFGIVGSILYYGGGEAVLRLLDFVALLSLSLAVVNLLPFPALDGGRIIFVLFEMLFRKKLDGKFEARLHKWGMVFLLGVLLLVTFKDIRLIF